MRLLPATATVAPGLNSVAWASLISAVPRPWPQPLMNLFGDIFGGDDMLKAQENFCQRPLLSELVQNTAASYVLQEKLFSLSGEDFRVRDTSGKEVIQINGANINVAGMVLDKLYFKSSAGVEFCSVERRMLATTTCYDIYQNGECVCKVDREMFAASPTYKFFYEGDMNPFPDFTATGAFSERKYTFKNGMGETIARVNRGEEAFRDVDTYQVEVAAGVDTAAIIAVAVIIDEDHDESDQKKKGEEKKEEGGGMWPFG
jgi:uncharacterized protein YxjI